MKSILIIISVLALSGCASSSHQKGELYSTPVDIVDDKAVVYLLRPSSFVGAARDYSMSVDGEVVTILPNGTYSIAYLEPGEHVFEAKKVPISLDKSPQAIAVQYTVDAGKEYFIGYFKKLGKEEDIFLHKERADVFRGSMENGLFDPDSIIGVLKKEPAIEELKKLKLSVKKPEKK